MAKKHHKHHGPATHSVRPAIHGSGGNLKLPHPSQAMHVAPQKDKMAHNVGGAEHMGPKGEFGPAHEIMESSGKGAPKKVKDRY